MNRVEKHRIRPSSPYYKMLREFCHLSKNLYNHANYLIRQTFNDEKKYLNYQEVDRLLKADAEYPDYRIMPSSLMQLSKHCGCWIGTGSHSLQALRTGKPIRKNIKVALSYQNTSGKMAIPSLL